VNKIAMTRYRSLTIVLLTPFALGVLLLSLAGGGAKFSWWLELTTHFKVQYLIWGGLLLPAVLWSRCRWLVAIVLFGVGLNAVAVLPWYIPTSVTPPHSEPVTIAFANVLRSNPNPEKLLQWVEDTQPAVVVLEEITPQLEAALRDWDRIFPYQLKAIRQDAFGIALYSQIPFTGEEIHTFGLRDIPWLETTLLFDNTPLKVWALHPYPPVSVGAAQQRNALLDQVSQQIQTHSQQPDRFQIVVGDLNTSVWSPFYQDFVRRSRLKNTRQGFGIEPTWPTYNVFLSTPLDHILVSPNLNVHYAQAGPFIGSDHLPFMAIVSIPDAQS
jgi:endonuclease/exonuclease/phosphatase (EEP) superfamily protein YafD